MGSLVRRHARPHSAANYHTRPNPRKRTRINGFSDDGLFESASGPVFFDYAARIACHSEEPRDEESAFSLAVCGFSSTPVPGPASSIARWRKSLEHPLPFPSKTGKIHSHAPRTELPQVRTPHVALSLLAQQLPHRTPPLRRLRIRRHSPAHPVQADQRLPRMPLRRHAPRRRKPQLHLTPRTRANT